MEEETSPSLTPAKPKLELPVLSSPQLEGPMNYHSRRSKSDATPPDA